MNKKAHICYTIVMLREFFQNQGKNSENSLKENDKKFEQMLRLSEQLDADEAKLYEQLGVKAEEAAAYLANPANFTPEDWDMIQNEIASYNQKIKLANDKRDQARLKQSYKERSSVQQHWLFIR